MKKIIYLYIITFDNQIKYFISEKETTYKMLEAKRFATRGKAKTFSDKLDTKWSVGVTAVPEILLQKQN